MSKKVLVVGDGSCGKTCLLHVFHSGEFPETYVPTIFEEKVKDLDIDGKTVKLLLQDTTGQEDYARLRPFAYKDVHIVLICFSIANPDSLENVKLTWSPEMNHFCSNAPVVLVGNKEDLRNDPETVELLENRRLATISKEQGMKMAAEIQAEAYVECSAKLNRGVQDVFKEVGRILLKGPGKKKAADSKSSEDSKCCNLL